MNTVSMEVENKTLDIIINESFNIETNIQNTNNQVNCIAQIIDSSLNITQSSQDIDVRITLKVKTQIEDIATIKVTKDISSCDVDESDLDSINIYIVKNESTRTGIAIKSKAMGNFENIILNKLFSLFSATAKTRFLFPS